VGLLCLVGVLRTIVFDLKNVRLRSSAVEVNVCMNGA
jgi:hypothetical protein